VLLLTPDELLALTGYSRACGLHACETPQRLDAHIDAAMKEAP
jgi:hypothetical protein